MSSVEHKKIGSMQKSDIVGDYDTEIITHFDGNQRTVYYSDRQVVVPAGEKIISVTDTEGYIITVNSTFVNISGYSKDELLGAPHYILHHPDMPRQAFKGLWDSLLETGRWQGYVKNLRKDGGFYWVFASIFSLQRHGKVVGYTSSRIAAEPEKIIHYSKVYKDMLEEERLGIA